MNPYIRNLLIAEEGLRLTAYKCTVGKTTIGVGRNLDDVGISAAECDVLFNNDLAHIEAQAKTLPYYESLDSVRQAVVLSALFQLGLRGWQSFTTTNNLIAAGKYAEAADAMGQSKWFQQTPNRVGRLMEMLRTGVLVRR